MSAQLRRSNRKRKPTPNISVPAAAARKKAATTGHTQRVQSAHTATQPGQQFHGSPSEVQEQDTSPAQLSNVTQLGHGLSSSAANAVTYPVATIGNSDLSLMHTPTLMNSTMPLVQTPTYGSEPSPISSIHSDLALNVPKNTHDKIQKGEYIDLAILLTDNIKPNKQRVGLEGGQFIVQPENNYKKITTIEQWTTAFINL